jgi:SAM-dependent methyltransferase
MIIPYPAWPELRIYNLLARFGYTRGNSLRQQLERAGRTRWLDLGSRSFHEGFHCLDIAPSSSVPADKRDRYISADILSLSDAEIDAIGGFDLVRMQHVFEHFGFEDGEALLRVCARLLNKSGYLLITVPDLQAHMRFYRGGYRTEEFAFFRDYAGGRVPQDAPASYFFSFHAHQYGHAPVEVPGQAHKWSYDADGLIYALKRVGVFDDVRRLRLWSPLAEIPFTHKIPVEDLCVLASKARGAGGDRPQP